MSETDKGIIVKDCCELAGCGIPEPGELAFDYVLKAYQAGFDSVYEENINLRQSIENLIPYNSYKTATIWTQLQLYNKYRANDEIVPYTTDRQSGEINTTQDFIELFQIMLFDVTDVFFFLGTGRKRR